MSVEQRFAEYNAARERFIAAHKLVRDHRASLSDTLRALKEGIAQVDQSQHLLTLAKQKLEQALHADASGVIGTPLPPDIAKVIDAAQAAEAAQ